MKKLIIAEKPSVATDLSKALGGKSAGITKQGKRGEEYFEGNDLVISSAVGHLVELYMPEDIDRKLKFWKPNTLPIMPDEFQLKVIPKTKSRFSLLESLLKRDDITEIYNACDAGREGELIFSYIYDLAKCSKPIHRMWMLSMTPAAIKDAYQNPRVGKDMVPLQNAARCRSEADWLIGINGTRAITLQMGGLQKMTTVGRVQTPTLTLVVNREKEIREFQPKQFARLEATVQIDAGSYSAVYQRPNFKKNPDDKHDRIDRIWNIDDAASIVAQIQAGAPAQIEESKKRTPQQAPRLYDLTSLQREANNRFGYSASRTLQYAQALYEKHKVITYPRTESRALPEDYPSTCVKTLEAIEGSYKPYADVVLQQNWVSVKNRRIFNNKQVSDHFAIVPTQLAPKKLTEQEQKIYNMILSRFIAAFYPPAQFDVTTRLSNIAGHTFKTEGKVLVEPSWLAVYGKTGDQQGHLVPLTPADGQPPTGKTVSIEQHNEFTKPPARYTEATLLSAMEGAGKLVEDEDMAEAMKEKGLGTPATRAATIEHLLKEAYIQRDGREILPCDKADDLIRFLENIKVDGLTSPDMTGEWEHKLLQMERGELSREEFMQGIKKFTKDIVDRVNEYDPASDAKPTDVISPTNNEPLLETLTHYISTDGNLKINKTMGKRKIELTEIRELLDKGVIGPLDGFTSKAGKPFSACLRFDMEEAVNKVKFEFNNNTEDQENEIDPRTGEKIGECPGCKEIIYETPKAWVCPDCSCKGTTPFKRFSRTVLENSINRDQYLKLLHGAKTDLLEGFKSRRTGRAFSARLFIKGNKLSFEFEQNKDKAPRKKAAEKK